MADTSLTEQTGKNLEKAIRDLTSAVGKSGIGASNKETSNGSADAAVKLSKSTDKILKNHIRYQQLLLEEKKIAEELLKNSVKNEKLEKARLDHIKKMNDLNKLQAAKTLSISVQQQKLIDIAKEEVKKAKENYDLTEKQVALDEERAKIIADNNIKEEKFSKSRANFDKARKISSDWLLGQAKDMFNSLLEQDSAISKMSANYALSKTESGELKNNLSKVAWDTQRIGVGMMDLVKIQTTYSDQMGRSVMLTGNSLKAIATIGVATGIGSEGAAGMAASFDQFGFSVESTAELVEKMMQNAKANGISASVATKNLESNIKTAANYSFARGLAGVSAMTVEAAKLKINFSTIGALADRLQSPEESLSLSASLSTMGGGFAAMADPLTLLNQGITDMEGLSKTYSNMLSGLATVNKKTGEISIGAYDRLRIKEVASKMGISMDEMLESTRQKARRDALVIPLKTVTASEQDKELITSLATFDKNKGEFTVNVRGKSTSVASLSSADIKYLQPDKVQLATVAENTMGIYDILKNNLEALKTGLIDLVLPAVNRIAEILNKVFGWIAPRIGVGLEGNRNLMNGAVSATRGIEPDTSNGFSSGAAGIGVGAIRSGILSGTLGTVAKGAGGVLLGGLISGGMDYIENKGKEGAGKHAAIVGGSAMAGSLVGGALGTFGGPLSPLTIPLGAAVGNFVGEKIGDFFASGNMDHGQDVLLPSGGKKPIMLNSRDDVYTVAGKPDGALNEVLSGRNTVQNSVEPTYSGTYSGGSSRNVGNGKFELNLTGGITLNVAGGNSSRIDAGELIKNQQFVRELSRLISRQLVVDKNGKYSGPLSSDSL